MLGYLYTIINTINGKEYIGKTYDSIETRFKQHINKAKNGSILVLHRAIRKYGEENFSVYLLDSLPEHELEKAEIEAISIYNTYKNGYNSTLGLKFEYAGMV